MKHIKHIPIKQILAEAFACVYFVALCVFGIVGWYFTHTHSGDLAFGICILSLFAAIVGGFGIVRQCGYLQDIK